MNIEMSVNFVAKGWLKIQRYCGQAANAVRAVIRKPAETVTCDRTRAMQDACIQRERYLAESTAQLQPVRYFR